MKIEIQNLGPIHHFEFDLEKDLHLLYGENNVGKSYAVNLVYCILEAFLQEERWLTFSHLPENAAYKKDLFKSLKEIPEYSKINSKIVNKMNSQERVDITHEYMLAIHFFTNQTLVKRINTSIYETYSSNLKNCLNEENASIKIKRNFYELRLAYEKDRGFIVDNIYHADFFKGATGHMKVDGFSFFDSRQGKSGIKEEDLCLEMAMHTYYHLPQVLDYSDIFILPSSRSGLNVLFNNLAFFYFQKSTNLIQKPNYSKPVTDYFLNLSSITSHNIEGGFEEIARKLEKILGGKILIDSTSNKIVYVSSSQLITIPIESSASMISELAPLILHLENLINRNKDGRVLYIKPLIIIEEPEAHLHPKVQIQLMEIFAELTKHNVKVILTSHSNYMFNKLSNMLLAKEIEPEKVAVYHMVMTDQGSIVKPDMEATAEGIEDHNFADVAQKLYQERLESYEVLNEEGDAYQ